MLHVKTPAAAAILSIGNENPKHGREKAKKGIS
jgi:hypothetical protein